MSICTGAVVPFWLHMNLLLVIVLVTCSSGPGIADVFPLLPPRLSIFMLTSVQHPQLLWMLTYNIWSYGSLWLYNYLYIHSHTCMHMSIYVITMYVCSLMLCDWMIGIQRRSRTHPFSDGAAVKPRVVAVLHHVEAEWLPCAQWSMSSDGWIVFW